MNIKQYASQRLTGIILEHLPKDGTLPICADDAFIVKRSRSGIVEHRFDRPLASLLVQGAKTTIIGSQKYEISENQILTVGIDMPSSSLILDASLERPLLTVYFHINPHMISEMLLELGWNHVCRHSASNGVSVSEADADFMETAARLAGMLDEKPDNGIRSRLLLQELHYLLLKGPQKNLLLALHGNGLPGRQLLQTIEYLKGHLDRAVRISDLTGVACMSESSLYRQFKKMTGLSPLQYHKQLRLHEARRLMLVENERAATAAFRVGFESIPQFSREYKRLFGQPPRRDTRRKNS